MSRVLVKAIQAAHDPTYAGTGKSPTEKALIKSRWGFFPELPEVKFYANGKQAELLKDFPYVRPDGQLMIARAGFVSDGASVPKIAWPIADSPFTGKNLFPALVHDFYCHLGINGWSPWESKEIHYMFHQGLRTRGESAWKARPKWFAVNTFGPRFDAGSLPDTIPFIVGRAS